MDVFSAGPADLVTGSTAATPANSYLAQLSLARGLDLYQKQDYKGALRSLQLSVGYAPNDPQSVNAYNYMAQSYAQLGDTKKAITTYQQSIKVDLTRNDTYVALGKLLYSQGDYPSAQTNFEKAIEINPDAATRYSLGEAYLADGRYSDAENQFAKVRGMQPNSPNGDYGLGQVYAKEGHTTDAINAFDRALSLQSNFWNALADKGYALADNGNIGEAQSVVKALTNSDTTDPSLASTLSAYVDQKSPPKMIAVSDSSTFTDQLSARTPLSSLSPDLVAPNSKTNLSMVFSFSKPMDPTSIQNVLNWSISRSTNTGAGGGYNFGLALPASETTLPPFPTAVVYDSTTQTATVYFQLQQNAAGNATIDPSHVKFAFNGKDADGNTMNPTADQYSGFSGFA